MCVGYSGKYADTNHEKYSKSISRTHARLVSDQDGTGLGFSLNLSALLMLRGTKNSF